MCTNHYNPQGKALLDFLNGDSSAAIIVENEFGRRGAMPVSVFFREPAEFSTLEITALNLCRGRVLDIGAGAGCHSLALQEHGLSVCAVDVVPECVEVMRRRGVKEAYCADISTFEAAPFDTLLCLMNGIAIAKNLTGLPHFLQSIQRLLKPGGQFLVDSTDLRQLSPESPLFEEQRHANRYFGDIELQLEYKGKKGAFLPHLFIDPDTLTGYAAKFGWICEVVGKDPLTGRFLVRLHW